VDKYRKKYLNFKNIKVRQTIKIHLIFLCKQSIFKKIKEVCTIKKLLSFLIVMIAMFMVASSAGAKEHSYSGKKAKFNDPEKVEWAIKKVRKATEKYHDVENALEDGYVQASPYVPQMGYWQYMLGVNNRIANKVTPEILVEIANSID
jgi:hypothetical protein